MTNIEAKKKSLNSNFLIQLYLGKLPNQIVKLKISKLQLLQRYRDLKIMVFSSFVVCRSITADSCYFDEDRIGALTTKSGTLTEDSILVII